jgi:hypothetical protein
MSLPGIQNDNYFTPHQHWKRFHCHDFDCSAVSSKVIEHKETYSGLFMALHAEHLRAPLALVVPEHAVPPAVTAETHG